jgi:hypothetical protein
VLASYIKQKPNWWHFIPWLSDFTANAIYPNIYLPKKVYRNLNSKNPKLKNKALLIHEKTHLQREKEIGWLKFGIRYLFSPKFRFKEEILAIKTAMKYQKRHRLSVNTKRMAKFLSGWIYLWPVSYEIAKKELDKAWQEA